MAQGIKRARVACLAPAGQDQSRGTCSHDACLGAGPVHMMRVVVICLRWAPGLRHRSMATKPGSSIDCRSTKAAQSPVEGTPHCMPHTSVHATHNTAWPHAVSIACMSWPHAVSPKEKPISKEQARHSSQGHSSVTSQGHLEEQLIL